MLFQDLLQDKENPNDRLFSCFAYTSQGVGFPNHCHLHMEMMYQLKGENTVVVDGRAYEMREGDLVFVPMLNPHMLKDAASEGARKLILQISPNFLGFGGESADLVRRLQSRHTAGDGLLSHLEPASAARSVLEDLGRECEAERDGSSAVLSRRLPDTAGFAALCRINGLVFSLIAELLQLGVLYVTDDVDSALSIHELERLVPVLEHMVSMPDGKFTLQDAAQMASMGYSSFSRAFRRAMGQNFIDYQNMLRVRTAETLLRRTDESITQIADRTNFGSLSYFNRVFKQINGVSPSAYRRREHAQNKTNSTQNWH